MSKRRILFIDNDMEFLDTRSEWLERAGFEILKATSLEQGEQFLQDRWVHLVIIDLRLRDDNDERDSSGITLAREPAYQSIPKIILTRFPSYEYVREALGPAIKGLPPAVDFLAKQEGADAMVQAVEEAFANYVRLNPTLDMHFEEPGSLLHLAMLVQPQADGDQLPDRANELEDLFRRLFHENDGISFNRLLVERGNRVFLSVFAYSAEGGEKKLLVTCGQKQPVLNDVRNYERLVPRAVNEGGILLNKTEETLHFAASTYTLVGGDLEETTTFESSYHHHPAEMILAGLDHLFNHTLALWYGKDRYLDRERSLHELCRDWLGWGLDELSVEAFNRRLESLCEKALRAGLAQMNIAGSWIRFDLADERYPNPMISLSNDQIEFSSPVLCGITHGQLHFENILADHRGRTWVIDFSRIQPGPLLCDFAALELTLKVDLLERAGLDERYRLEQQLLAVSRLDDPVEPVDLSPEAQKALVAVGRVRQEAARVIGQDRAALRAYRIGLLYCALDRLAQFDPELRYPGRGLMPYLHALVAAAILTQALTPEPRADLPSQALRSLWIDMPNKGVWVEGQEVQLTPQEFELLAYVYNRKQQLCRRTEIVKNVFEVNYGPDMSEHEKKRVEEARLNSAISRLRKKLEPDPDRPKYIIAIRGEGYKLTLDHPY